MFDKFHRHSATQPHNVTCNHKDCRTTIAQDYAGVWDTLSTSEERYIENHFEDFRDGLTDNCDCSYCNQWRDQERKDLENV